MKKLCLGVMAAVFAVSLAAAEVLTFVPADKMPVYKCGEKAAFTLSVFDNGKAVTGGKYTVVFTLDGNKKIGEQIVDLAQGNPATVTTTLDKPGFVLVRVLNSAGKPAMTPGAKGKRSPPSPEPLLIRKKSRWGMIFPKISWLSGKPEANRSPAKKSSWKRWKNTARAVSPPIMSRSIPSTTKR